MQLDQVCDPELLGYNQRDLTCDVVCRSERFMAISISCLCGTLFEVPETLAGQSISCPECQVAVTVPASTRVPLRTSGYALASVISALVGMFTVVFTVLAVILGIAALVSISRHRNTITGKGFAICGIAIGTVFTGLTVFALSRDEVFDQFRATMHTDKIDFTGPLEIVRPEAGFAITRPSSKWGIAGATADPDDDLTLANPSKDAFIEISSRDFNPADSLEKFRDELSARLREPRDVKIFNQSRPAVRVTGFTIRESKHLPAENGIEVMEFLVDLKMAGNPLGYIIRVCRRERAERVFTICCWTAQRRMPVVEPDIRRALESFRLLK